MPCRLQTGLSYRHTFIKNTSFACMILTRLVAESWLPGRWPRCWRFVAINMELHEQMTTVAEDLPVNEGNTHLMWTCVLDMGPNWMNNLVGVHKEGEVGSLHNWMPPNGGIDLGQHWPRYWLVEWESVTITWTNVDVLWKVFYGINLNV